MNANIILSTLQHKLENDNGLSSFDYARLSYLCPKMVELISVITDYKNKPYYYNERQFSRIYNAIKPIVLDMPISSVELAYLIDTFGYIYDPYHYMDTVGSTAEEKRMSRMCILTDIYLKNVTHYIKECKNILEELSDDDMITYAKSLIRELAVHS